MAHIDSNSKGVPTGAPFFVLAWAGLAGAAGVGLAAAAAHKVSSPPLQSAAEMLMIHAAAALALVAVGLGAHCRCYWLGCAALMLTGATLFSGEIALHVLADMRPLPVLAPIGGTLMILSWLAVALLAMGCAIKKQ